MYYQLRMRSLAGRGLGFGGCAPGGGEGKLGHGHVGRRSAEARSPIRHLHPLWRPALSTRASGLRPPLAPLPPNSSGSPFRPETPRRPCAHLPHNTGTPPCCSSPKRFSCWLAAGIHRTGDQTYRNGSSNSQTGPLCDFRKT
jgi:hypothetical protein